LRMATFKKFLNMRFILSYDDSKFKFVTQLIDNVSNYFHALHLKNCFYVSQALSWFGKT